MRVFLAGASGVIGVRLLPLLIAEGYTVAAMTRSPGKRDSLAAMGAEPVVCDVYDAAALTDVVTAFGAEVVVHQLTDLPDRVEDLPQFVQRNSRVRGEGTRSLLAAAAAAGARHFLAQSIAWVPPGSEQSLAEFEGMVLEAGGVVVRYGQFYGPGTYHEERVPPHPRVHVDEAARRTPPLLTAPSGVVEVAEAESDGEQ